MIKLKYISNINKKLVLPVQLRNILNFSEEEFKNLKKNISTELQNNNESILKIYFIIRQNLRLKFYILRYRQKFDSVDTFEKLLLRIQEIQQHYLDSLK